jgi:hypothetical protein
MRRCIELLAFLCGELLGAIERLALPRAHHLLEEARRPTSFEFLRHQFGDEPGGGQPACCGATTELVGNRFRYVEVKLSHHSRMAHTSKFHPDVIRWNTGPY